MVPIWMSGTAFLARYPVCGFGRHVKPWLISRNFFGGQGYHHVVIILDSLLSLGRVGEDSRAVQSVFEGHQPPWLAGWPQLVLLLCFLFLCRVESSARVGEC